ncbi:hypothetical protein P171DRAFT_485970 [Karstenula rhodostoma CBS 690.94]|uniref:Uncharacterized protein n=1 Tax=Karstenula rhodostoma CBS 690.94 TaxID=1392251 RepID=A0A9P4PI78_9PLEO|nr:hypothetical protein P171DRAFT_485970 [Karstenula rhodostoma CBS 690.94]
MLVPLSSQALDTLEWRGNRRWTTSLSLLPEPLKDSAEQTIVVGCRRVIVFDLIQLRGRACMTFGSTRSSLFHLHMSKDREQHFSLALDVSTKLLVLTNNSKQRSISILAAPIISASHTIDLAPGDSMLVTGDTTMAFEPYHFRICPRTQSIEAGSTLAQHVDDWLEATNTRANARKVRGTPSSEQAAFVTIDLKRKLERITKDGEPIGEPPTKRLHVQSQLQPVAAVEKAADDEAVTDAHAADTTKSSSDQDSASEYQPSEGRSPVRVISHWPPTATGGDNPTRRSLRERTENVSYVLEADSDGDGDQEQGPDEAEGGEGHVKDNAEEPASVAAEPSITVPASVVAEPSTAASASVVVSTPTLVPTPVPAPASVMDAVLASNPTPALVLDPTVMDAVKKSAEGTRAVLVKEATEASGEEMIQEMLEEMYVPGTGAIAEPGEVVIEESGEAMVGELDEAIIEEPGEAMIGEPDEAIIEELGEVVIEELDGAMIGELDEAIIEEPGEAMIGEPDEAIIEELGEVVIEELDGAMIGELDEAIIEEPGEAMIGEPDEAIIEELGEVVIEEPGEAMEGFAGQQTWLGMAARATFVCIGAWGVAQHLSM